MAKQKRGRGKKRLLLLIPVILIIAVIAVVAVTIYSNTVSFDSYVLTSERKQDDTLSYSYCAFGSNVLQYGADGATLLEDSETVVWEENYNMSLPKVSVGSKYAVIYDKNAMDVMVFDQEEKVGSFSTGVPIVRAVVSETGTVAAILDDGSSTWVNYYKSDGEEISTILTKMDEQGYPMDIALSPNGEILAVSYLGYSSGVQESQVCFYNFADTGDNQEDNLVSHYSYPDTVIPDLEYIDDTTSVAFRSDGLVIYQGKQRPEKKKEVTTSKDIISVFHSDQYVGMVLESDSQTNPFTLKLYDTDGEEKVSQKTSFVYDSVEIKDDNISFYLREKFCVYNTRGKKRFEGSYEEQPQAFFALGGKNYVTVTDEGIHWIKLK